MKNIENKFRIKPLGENYLTVEYIGYVPTNVTQKVWLSATAAVNNMTCAETFMNNVLDLEKSVKLELEKRELPYDVSRVIVENVRVIESWVEPIMLISKFSKKEITEWIVNSFHKQYTKDREKVSKLYESSKGKPINYLENYNKCDEYDKLNKYWDFGFEPLVFGKGILDKMEESLDLLKNIVDKMKEKI